MIIKTAIISDTHNNHEKLLIDRVDLLIHCGDFTNLGKFDEILNFSRWLNKLDVSKIIICPGNHDLLFEKNENLAKQLLFKHIENINKIVYLKDAHFNFEGIKIYATPWVPQYYNWAFMRSEEELKFNYENIPDGLDILITHGPPFSILDNNHIGENGGSLSLLQEVLLKEPKYNCFGHFHREQEDKRILINPNLNGYTLKTTFINAAMANHGHEIIHNPIIIDFEIENNKVLNSKLFL